MNSYELRKRLLIAEANLQRSLLGLELESVRHDLQEAAWKAGITAALTTLAGVLIKNGSERRAAGVDHHAPRRRSIFGNIIAMLPVGISVWKIFNSMQAGAAMKGNSTSDAIPGAVDAR